MNTRKWAALLLVLGVLLLLASCGKKEAPQESSKTETQQAQPAGGGAKVDPATAATIAGVVKFDGTAPKPQKIDMSQDPACKGTNETETIEANGGKLANVFVYVKDGLGDRT